MLKEEYQEPLERIEHQLNIKRQMGASEAELRKQIQNQDRLKSEYVEVQNYLIPILAAKKADDERATQKLQEWGAKFGGNVSITSSGYPALHIPRQTVTVSSASTQSRGAK